MENENNNIEEVTQNTSPEVENIASGTDNDAIQTSEAPQQTEATPSVDTTSQQAPIESENQQQVSEVPQVNNTGQTQEMAPILDAKEEKKGKSPLPIIIAIIAIVGIMGLLFLPKLLVSKKKIVENEITTVFTAAKKSLKEGEKNILEYDLEKDSLGLNGSLTIDSNYKNGDIDLTKLKNYKIVYQGAIDKKGNEASAQLELLKGTKNLIAIDSYTKGKNVLLSLGDIYKKGLTTTLEKEIKELDLSKTKNTKDIETLIEKTEKIVKGTIKDENITKTKEEKEINGKKDKYTKIEYKINLNEFSKEVLTAYQNDSEIITILANLTEQTEKDIKDLLKDAIDNIDSKEDLLIINNYVKGFNNELKEIEIIDDESTIIIDKDGNIYKYRMENAGEKIFSGEYNSKEESFTLETELGMSLKMTTENDSKIISFNYKQGSTSLALDAKIQNKVKGATQENNIEIKISYKSDSDNISATLQNDLTISKNQKIEKINKTPTEDIDDLTEEELQDITLAFYEKIEDLIYDIMPSMADSGTSFREIMG